MGSVARPRTERTRIMSIIVRIWMVAVVACGLTSCGSSSTPKKAPTCTDGIKNGMETDVDCGGPTCAPCAAGKACTVAVDCSTGACISDVCRVPTCTDGTKDGNETDVYCGGS